MCNGMRPIHPGEILKADVLDELGLSAAALARALRVPTNRITAIIKEERALTADTALRLARYLGGEQEFWLNIQSAYDLKVTEKQAGRAIEREAAPRAA